jgi:hypothetical protein
VDLPIPPLPYMAIFLMVTPFLRNGLGTRVRTVSVEMRAGKNLNDPNTEREKAPPRQPCLSVLRPL